MDIKRCILDLLTLLRSRPSQSPRKCQSFVISPTKRIVVTCPFRTPSGRSMEEQLRDSSGTQAVFRWRRTHHGRGHRVGSVGVIQGVQRLPSVPIEPNVPNVTETWSTLTAAQIQTELRNVLCSSAKRKGPWAITQWNEKFQE